MALRDARCHNTDEEERVFRLRRKLSLDAEYMTATYIYNIILKLTCDTR